MKFDEAIEIALNEQGTGENNSNWKPNITKKSWKYHIGRTLTAGQRKHGGKKDLGYRAYHMRLQKEKGKASDYKCRKCGEPAMDWAVLGKGKTVPLCRSCHNKEHHKEKNFKSKGKPKN